MKRKIVAFALALLMVLLPVLSSCSEESDDDNGTEPEAYKVTHTAKIEIASYGVVELELYGEIAPITVDNFASLANVGFYNGLTFHRIIDGFMMQGGGFDTTGEERRSVSITGEFK